jgi:hypothetical protein
MVQTANVGGFFAGIDKAERRADANYLRPGSYSLELSEVKAITTRTRRNAFVIEAVVRTATEGSANAVGDRVSHMVMLDTDGALSDIKAFAAAATGLAFDEVDAAGMEALCGPAQPLRGRFVDAFARDKETKKGTAFTRITYSAPANQEPLGSKRRSK